MSDLMVPGGDALAKTTQAYLNDTPPHNVGIRYSATNDDLEDVEAEDNEELTAQYTNTPVLGTATREITCGGSATDQQGASRHTLVIEDSAWQSETDMFHGLGLSFDGQRQCPLQSVGAVLIF